MKAISSDLALTTILVVDDMPENVEILADVFGRQLRSLAIGGLCARFIGQDEILDGLRQVFAFYVGHGGQKSLDYIGQHAPIRLAGRFDLFGNGAFQRNFVSGFLAKAFQKFQGRYRVGGLSGGQSGDLRGLRQFFDQIMGAAFCLTVGLEAFHRALARDPPRRPISRVCLV